MLELAGTPLVLGAWTMAWRRWFDLRTPAWVPAAIGALTLLYVILQAADLGRLVTVRVCFLLLYLGAVYHGARRRPRDTWLGVATVLSLAVALFADDLSLAYIYALALFVVPYGGASAPPPDVLRRPAPIAPRLSRRDGPLLHRAMPDCRPNAVARQPAVRP